MATELLAPDEEYSARNTSGHYEEIEVDNIRPSLLNPRKRFDAEPLQDLTASIRLFGILENLVVRRIVDLEGLTNYEIIAGERRLRAAKMAGLNTVPCVIREASELEIYEMRLTENFHREGLTPLEEAEGYRYLLSHGRSQTDIAHRIGKKQPYVSSTLKLLDLPESVQQILDEGQLTRSHGEALCPLLSEPDLLLEMARMAVERDWGTRFLEDAVRKAKEERERGLKPSLAGTEPSDTETTDSDLAHSHAVVSSPGAKQEGSPSPIPASAPAPGLERPDTSTLLRNQTPAPAVTTASSESSDRDARGSLPTSAPNAFDRGTDRRSSNASVDAPSPPSKAPVNPLTTGAAARTQAPSSAPAANVEQTPPSAAMVQCLIPVALDDWLYEAGFDTTTQALELFRLLGDVAARKGVTLKAFINTLIEEN